MTAIPDIIIELKPSSFLPGEVGLFAAADIPQGTVVADKYIFEDNQVFCDREEIGKMSEFMQKKVVDFGLLTPEGAFIPKDFNKMQIGWHMNHRCDYNVGFNGEGDFVASRDIKKGEELCWDYSLGVSDPSFSMPCKCGASGCRGVITGNDWKDEEYRANNSTYMLRELLT